jgi:hypothetical protein
MNFNFIYEGIHVSHFNKIHIFFLLHNVFVVLLFLFFLLVLVQIIGKIYCMLHITSYHHYSLVEIHFHQGYFNLSCHVIEI